MFQPKHIFLTTGLSHWIFLPWEIRVVFPGENQVRQSRATQSTVHSGYFSASLIHRTLTWTAGSLTCAQMLMDAIVHGGVRTHVRESAPKVDSGRKIPCRTGESNLRQRRAGPMLYQLSYIPIPAYISTLCYIPIPSYISTLCYIPIPSYISTLCYIPVPFLCMLMMVIIVSL